MAFTSFHGPDFTFEALSPDKGPLTTQLVAWHRQAVAAGRIPCVYLTATWCPPSVKLERSLTDPRMQRAFRGVHAATFDVDVWANELAEAGFSARVVPVFFILDAEGRPVGPTITGGAWGENDPENMAPPLERFFDAQRPTPAPARGAFAPPLAPTPAATASSPLRGIAMVTLALVLIGVAAWLKVRQGAADDAAARNERLRQEVEASIRNSLREQSK